MATEIERKFLVKNDDYKSLSNPVYYRQGYIPTVNGMTVRIRIAGDKGFITLKDRAKGFSRNEFEYEIPVAEAQQMLELMCEKPQIEKYRYKIAINANNTSRNNDIQTPSFCPIWEVDEFLGENEGLVVAEIELPSEETPVSLPSWVGKEVTSEKKYYNSHLCKNPYCNWSKE